MQVKLNKDAVTPLLVDNHEEFVLYIHSFLEAFCKPENLEEATMVVRQIKVLMHEYLAGVVNGYIPPFEIDNMSDNTVVDFKDMISEMRQQLAIRGVPTKENNTGGLEIDFDKTKEMLDGENNV